MDYVDLYFQDELPAAFGCGHQHVLVLGEPESKTVQLIKISTCETGTLPRPVYADMARARNSRTLELDAPSMIDRLFRNAEIYGTWSSAVREALVILGCPPERLPRSTAVAAIVDLEAGEIDATEVPMAGEGSGKFMQRLWMAGVNDPDRLVALVLAAWPGRKTKKSDVFYNYNLLIKNGVTGVPPWPSKK